MIITTSRFRSGGAPLLIGLASLLFCSVCFSASKTTTVLKVIDTYVEMHSGPAQSYPVFYVIEQGEEIELLTRRPDWYEVRAANGRIGWVAGSQIARTIQATGEPADLPSVGYGDYIKNTWVSGFSAGQFVDDGLFNLDLLSIEVGYRILSWLGVGLEAGRVFGDEKSGDLYGAHLFLEPFSHWRFSPYLSLGGGSLDVQSAPELPAFTFDSSFQSYGLGASYYLGRNFVIKGEYRAYSVSVDNQDDKENTGAWKFGFTTFF